MFSVARRKLYGTADRGGIRAKPLDLPTAHRVS